MELDARALEDTVAELQPNSPERAIALRALRAQPVGDPRLLPFIEALLTDETVVLIDMEPMRFGSIRWLAATVLVSEQQACALEPSLTLTNMAAPLNVKQVRALAQAESDPQAATEDAGILARRHARSIHWPRGRFVAESGLSLDDPQASERLDHTALPPSPPFDLYATFDPARHSPPVDDTEIAWRLDELGSGDAQRCADALPLPPERPTGILAVATALRALLTDGHLAVADLTEGPSVAELRWLAAHALAWELRAAGATEPVSLGPTLLPVPQSRALGLARQIDLVGQDEQQLAVRAVEASRSKLPSSPVMLDAETTLSAVGQDVLIQLADRTTTPAPPVLGHHLLQIETGGYDDIRLEPLLAALLEDRRLLVGWLPTCVGEVRWFAAFALAGSYRARGRPRDVVVPAVHAPVPHASLVTPECTDVEGRYAKQRAAGQISFGDLRIDHAFHVRFLRDSEGG